MRSGECVEREASSFIDDPEYQALHSTTQGLTAECRATLLCTSASLQRRLVSFSSCLVLYLFHASFLVLPRPYRSTTNMICQ